MLNPLNQKESSKNPPIFAAWMANWKERALNTILPPRCPVNGSIVERIGAISPEAWKNLTFISDPKCACCGVPFALDTSLFETPDSRAPSLLCGECLATPRPYDTARAVFVYDDGSRPMILAFKHGDQTHLHTTIAPLLAQCALDKVTDNTVLIPVPLHWTRLLKRRYNQSAILTNAMANILKVSAWNSALLRTRATPPQGHKSNKERHDNVAGAFRINPHYADKIVGKSVILVDDVITTGATLESCAHILKKHGVTSVDCVAIARVTRGE